MKKRQAGFTLLEVVLVSALLAIIATVGIVRYEKVNLGYKIERYAQETAADLRWLQRQAVNGGGGIWLMQVAPDGRQYQLISRNGGVETVVRKLSLQDEALKIKAQSINGGNVQDSSEISFSRDFNKLGYRLQITANDGSSKYVHVAATTARTRVSDSADILPDDGE